MITVNKARGFPIPLRLCSLCSDLSLRIPFVFYLCSELCSCLCSCVPLLLFSCYELYRYISKWRLNSEFVHWILRPSEPHKYTWYSILEEDCREGFLDSTCSFYGKWLCYIAARKAPFCCGIEVNQWFLFDR